MRGKYSRLTEHLSEKPDCRWVATFEEIERVLGFPLPESARSYQAWWSNQMRSQSLSWQSAGWKTTALDLDNGCVTFVHVGGGEPDDVSEPPRDKVARPLTIADAKAGLAVQFGVDPSQVEITIRA